MNRRQFAFAAAGLPLLRPERVMGANERLRIGWIGVGNRALWLLQNEFLLNGGQFPDAEIVAIADIEPNRISRFAGAHPGGAKWAKYADHRQMLDKEKLDAVFIETTTHARVLCAMNAMMAGCDVYAEKPLTLTLQEGRTLSNATRKLNRVLTTGTQQRSIPINAWASNQVRDGAIGKVHTVLICNFLAPLKWTGGPADPIPPGLNWDQWCNQTELRPYNTKMHRGWANYWDYDGGGMSWGVSGWGTHSLDQMQAGLGTDDTGPVEILIEDPAVDPVPVTLRYAGGTLVRLDGPQRDHADLGAIFLGTKGRLEIKRGSIVCEPKELAKGAPPDTPEGPGEDQWHIQNFFDCVKSRKLPNADVEIGHRSTSVCQLVNIARELNRNLKWNPKTEQFVDDAQANALLSRPRRPGYELPKV